ncbi:helix-turn-helix transcriptional regulator [Desulfosudis oleivorans]|uniref:helix-turn-helix transcriptional regulator n=1 Tax=Desulfosudis oleivorans TaxID=181663 RepID=UPI0009FF0A15
MKRKESLWGRELWTQQEVARHFRVSANTIKNWRRRGLFSYFVAPGSDRVLYYRTEIEHFQKTFTEWRKEEQKGQKHVGGVKPRLSSDNDWRIS